VPEQCLSPAVCGNSKRNEVLSRRDFLNAATALLVGPMAGARFSRARGKERPGSSREEWRLAGNDDRGPSPVIRGKSSTLVWGAGLNANDLYSWPCLSVRMTATAPPALKHPRMVRRPNAQTASRRPLRGAGRTPWPLEAAKPVRSGGGRENLWGRSGPAIGGNEGSPSRPAAPQRSDKA
jgi:hypothetical protein